MTLAAFRALRPKHRIQLTMQAGIYLLTRPWLGGTLQLFFLPTAARGIFVELSYKASTQAFIMVNSCTEAVLLNPYLDQVYLSALANE